MQSLTRRGVLSSVILAAGATAIGGTALAQSRVEVIVPTAPPPPRVEVVPALPPERVEVEHWIPGHWRWNGGAYEWVQGHYMARPRRGAVWVPARWERRSTGWVYIEGHWG